MGEKLERNNNFDISFATGDLFYAPGWQMMSDFKNKKISKGTFKKLYLNLMKIRFENPRMKWKIKKLLDQEQVFIVGKGELHHIWLKEFIKKGE